jgi:hypothetical protein
MHLPTTEDKKRMTITADGEFKVIDFVYILNYIYYFSRQLPNGY